MAETKQLYDIQKRGATPPVYSPAEDAYRNSLLTKLVTAYGVREQPLMELNDMSYSEYYLINRQQDMAYNPPKRNAADSRIVSGVTHEKDSTILSILTAMNFQPKVRVFDNDDKELKDVGMVMTAKLKKSLIIDNFKEKLADFLRVNISQGNVFVENRRDVKYHTKKIQTNTGVTDPMKIKWKTILEKEDLGCTSILVPNTAVFFANIQEKDIHKQPYIFVVMHIPVTEVAAIFKDFPRWKNVPKFPSDYIPQNVNGVYGDYYLQLPSDNYVEVIMYQSEPLNEYNVLLNGVMMFDIQEESGITTGFPLTYFSPSGKYTLSKGDNETIPFFAYGKSTPSKTQVKEETMNELMRLMVYKMRQSAKPPVGNNSDEVLQSNVWDPGVITPDIRKDDLSILTPNAGITGADFSFYQLVQQSIAESSVSASVEGTNQNELTATQYLDQKRENLKKLGLSIDQTIGFLKDVYWARLYNEISYFDTKKKTYNPDEDAFVEAYENFTVDENIDGAKGRLSVNLVDDNSMRTGNGYMKNLMDEEEMSDVPTRKMFVKPGYVQGIIKNMRNKIYIDVVAEPEGQGQQLLAALFNLLTQYANLRGGDTKSINFEYIEKLIGDNSGFDASKLFTEPEPMPELMGPEGMGATGPGGGSPPKPSFIPQNKTRSAPNAVLSK